MARESLPFAWFQWLRAPEQNFLRWGIAGSILVHAVVLAWPANHPARPDQTLQTDLEVVIVNTFGSQDPLTPTVIAQASLEGGGDQSQRVASSPSARAGEVDADISLAAMTQQRRVLEAQQEQLLTRLVSLWQISARPTDTGEMDKQDTEGADRTDQEALEMNDRMAAIMQEVERYNARPRKHYDAPSAIGNRFAAYIEGWRQAVELTGSEHYPRDGDRRPTGSLQATVTIDAAGRVIDVALDRPATDPVLNQAVRRILQLAGPFASFPPEFAGDIDQLVITRTWEFTAGQLTTKAP